MSDLRSKLIRLAHQNPELRGEILPLLKEAGVPSNLRSLLKGVWVEVNSIPVVAIRYHQGRWGAIMKDGLVNSYTNLAKFRYQLVNSMQVPQREGWRAVKELEDKVKASKTAAQDKEAGGTAILRRMMRLRVRIMTSEQASDDHPGLYKLRGKMNLDFGDSEIAPIFFRATVLFSDGQWGVTEFAPRRAVSGAGADSLKDFYEAALVEVLDDKGPQLVY